MAVETTVSEQRYEEQGSKVGWGAIFSGGLVGLAVFATLILLGSAIGLSVLSPNEPGSALSTGTGIGAGIYLLVSTLLAYFVGGYIASRLAEGIKFKMTAALHGLTSWALIAVAFTFLIGSGISAVVGTGFSALQQGAQAIMSSNVQQQAGKAAEKAGVAKDIKSEAKEAKSKIQGAISSAKSPEGQQKMGEQAKNLAGQAAKVAAGGSWFAFSSLFLGAIAAIFGALLGAPYRKRAIRHHVRTTDRHAA